MNCWFDKHIRMIAFAGIRCCSLSCPIHFLGESQTEDKIKRQQMVSYEYACRVSGFIGALLSCSHPSPSHPPPLLSPMTPPNHPTSQHSNPPTPHAPTPPPTPSPTRPCTLSTQDPALSPSRSLGPPASLSRRLARLQTARQRSPGCSHQGRLILNWGGAV